MSNLWASFCYSLLGYLNHMWSIGLQNRNCTWCFFYAFKWFAMAMWRYPSWEERLQSKELGNLCLTSERSITATCFAQSTLKGTVFSWQLCFPFNCTICREKNKSQGYVNEILFVWRQIHFSIYRHRVKIHDIETLRHFYCEQEFLWIEERFFFFFSTAAIRVSFYSLFTSYFE